MAPEMLKEKCLYDEKVDIWAVGILTYRLLSKEFPFFMYKGEDEEDLKYFIINDEPDYKKVSGGNLAKEFIACCLKKNPEERSGAENLLKHGWFKLHEWCITKDFKFDHDKFEL